VRTRPRDLDILTKLNLQNTILVVSQFQVYICVCMFVSLKFKLNTKIKSQKSKDKFFNQGNRTYRFKMAAIFNRKKFITFT